MFSGSDIFTKPIDTPSLSSLSSFSSIILCGGYVLLLVLPFSLIVWTIFWIWMMVDLVQRKHDEFGVDGKNSSKRTWLILMILANLLTAVAYYFKIYKKIPRERYIQQS